MNMNVQKMMQQQYHCLGNLDTVSHVSPLLFAGPIKGVVGWSTRKLKLFGLLLES